ncbi:hypothetical protein [Saccharothrix sp. ALI-22-I]|uniref:hypothetical protein n=1 Tax=Saccharothrix sp. ALI-22-I TaxID=1933778 RepID=UPI0015C3E7E7|nr:hypothetical protein [Saccharothrix sp. ALI-22-I]
MWTVQALGQGMERIGYGVLQIPTLTGWAIGPWSREGGLQLQQPDGTLFVYVPGPLDPAWIDAAENIGWVVVLHGPNLGLRVPPTHPDVHQERKDTLTRERQQGMVTGGLMRWGGLRES